MIIGQCDLVERVSNLIPTYLKARPVHLGEGDRDADEDPARDEGGDPAGRGVAPRQAHRRLHLAGRRHSLGATTGQSVGLKQEGNGLQLHRPAAILVMIWARDNPFH